MDDLDHGLIAELRRDGRASISELADRLQVSRATVRLRLERLKAAGEIAGFIVLTRADISEAPVRGLMMIGIEGRGGDRITARLTGLLRDVLDDDRRTAALDSVTAVMSLLEGHADVMMDRAAPGLVPQVDLLRRSMEARRDAPGLVQLIFRVLGLTAKREQYRDGARFCRAVLDAAGVDALNLAFAAPDLLPDPAELHDPDRWLRRVPARVG